MKNKFVDFLIITGDSGFNNFRNQIGMRTLGAAKIAHFVRKNGYTVQVIAKTQLLSTDKEIIDLCKPFVGPNTVLGIGTSLMIAPSNSLPDNSKLVENKYDFQTSENIFGSQQWSYIKNLYNTIEYFRKQYNNKIIIGGSSASSFTKLFNADFHINGYAEDKILPVLDKWLNHGIRKQQNSQWTIQTCDFEWHETDCLVSNEVVPIELARGCIFTCKFCAWEMIGKKKGTYERDIELVRNELINNYEKHGITHYQLMDDTFNDNDERVNRWCDMLETLPFKIYYSGYLRIDLCHRYQDTTRRLYQTGLRGAHFGIETFHPGAAKSIGKAFSGTTAKEFIPQLWQDIFNKDVRMFATMIVGLPEETEKDIRYHFEFVKSNPYLKVRYAALRLPTGDSTKSIFSADLPKFGYKEIGHKSGRWESQWMTQADALRIAKDLNILVDTNCSCDSWTYLYYHSMGATMDEVDQYDWGGLYQVYSSQFDAQNKIYFENLKKI